MHPYGYDTPDDHGHWWKNFYKQLPLGSTKRFSYNACLNLSDMINTWTTSGTHRGIPKSQYYGTKYSFASLRLPVIFTEHAPPRFPGSPDGLVNRNGHFASASKGKRACEIMSHADRVMRPVSPCSVRVFAGLAFTKPSGEP